jgi:phosphoglycolate phosphatase
MYRNSERLIVFDVDGTIVDAYSVIVDTFSRHGMELGDLERFQKRHNLFKYLGGIKEFPFNLRKQLGKRSRKNLLSTLTDVYRDDAKLYPGMAYLIHTLVATPGIRVGLVTRNITNEPLLTIRKVLSRHEIDLDAFDFAVHLPLGEEKTHALRSARKSLGINPARSYACGDEHKDFTSAMAAGMHPFIGSYGFEDYTRLTKKFLVPEDVISRTPKDLSNRLLHALDIEQMG